MNHQCEVTALFGKCEVRRKNFNRKSPKTKQSAHWIRISGHESGSIQQISNKPDRIRTRGDHGAGVSEWTPEGVYDFCRSRIRTQSRIFERKPDPELEQE